MRQTLILIFILILILAAAYIWYTYARPAEISETPVANTGVLADRLVPYRRLKNLQPDATVLQNPLYISLQDFGAGPFIPSLRGRINPFSPF